MEMMKEMMKEVIEAKFMKLFFRCTCLASKNVVVSVLQYLVYVFWIVILAELSLYHLQVVSHDPVPPPPHIQADSLSRVVYSQEPPAHPGVRP
eukprot:746425-Hanusia_phi.AAC.7